MESEVLKKTWDQNSLSINSKDEGKEYKISMDLVDQAIEYDLLMMLSNHLYVYFMFKPKLRNKLRAYKREDIPQILFKNSFLELFSNPTEKRAAFWNVSRNKKEKSDKKEKNTLYSSDFREVSTTTMEGHKFEIFELVLPQKSEISRPRTGHIKVKSRYIEIDIRIEFNGYSSTTLENFTRFYLGEDNYTNIEQHDLSIKLSFQLNKIAMLFNNSLEFEKWIDSFIHKIDTNYSIDSYLERINWENINAIMISTINFNKSNTPVS